MTRRRSHHTRGRRFLRTGMPTLLLAALAVGAPCLPLFAGGGAPVEPPVVRLPHAGTAADVRAVPDRERDGETESRLIESIVVTGNRKTRDHVILRELLLHQGDTFDELLANASRLRLLGLGYFREVRMSLVRGSRRGWVVWRIDVRERLTLMITSGSQGSVGVSGSTYGFGLSERNFLGTGQTLLSWFQLRSGYEEVTLGWIDPHFLGSNLMAGVRADLFEAENRFLGPDSQSRAVARGYSLAPFVGLNAMKFSRLYLGLKYDRVDNEYRSRGELSHGTALFTGRSAVAAVGAAYAWSRLNDPFLPSEGIGVLVAAEKGVDCQLGDFGYQKLTVDTEGFYPLAPRHVVRVEFSGGVIGGDAPFYEQFNLAQMIRGVRNYNDRWRDVGLALRVEYKYLIRTSRRRFIDQWEWVVFADGGNTWDRERISLSDLEYSVGTGARLDTRIGLINLVAALYSTYDHYD